jgi:transposase
MEGLNDIPGRGRPRVFDMNDRLKVITEACNPPNKTTYWTIRDLRTHLNKEHSLKMSNDTIHQILKSTDLKPHQYEMWCNSQDPDFEAKQIDIIGLYMNPPENAIVLCVDEKTGMQALGRKYHKPMKPGYPEKFDNHYIRHGTKSLIAAFLVHKGNVFGKCYDRHRHKEFIDFLNQVEKRYPKGELHIVVDNLSVHKHDKVKKWLKRRDGRIKFHFTPTHASWLNQIELWFNILSRKTLKRGIFNSREELVEKVMDFIEEYNKEAKPFKWTYTGEPLKI